MKRITVREYERIPVADSGDTPGFVTRPEARSLVGLATRLARPSLPAALSWASDTSITASSIVGVISDGRSLIEILPKTDRGHASQQRLDLLGMIARTLSLDVSFQTMAAAHWDQLTDFAEILARAFLAELLEQIRRGLPREYVTLEDDLTRLRGRLDVIRQYTALALAPQRLACRFDELLPDIPLNQALKCALLIAEKFTRRNETRRLALEARMFFDRVSTVNAWSLRLDQVRFDRTNVRFARLFALACLLIDGFRQTTAISERQGFALLFDMNILFEQFVAACCQEGLARTEWKVFCQEPQRFALRDTLTGQKKILTIPDISLRRNDGLTVIIDTKWKLFEPTDGHRTSNSDVYQMIAYSLAHDARDTILLYPHLTSLGSESGIQQSLDIIGGKGRIHFATVDLQSIRDVPNVLRRLLAPLIQTEIVA